MKIAICAAFITVFSATLHAQVLNGDVRFPLLNQIRWDMSREKVLSLCTANRINVGENDTTVSFDMKVFDVEAKTLVRFKNKAEKPWLIEVKFKELTDKLVDTLVNHFTRTTGESPLRAAKEKSLLLITMRMEVAAWKTKTEKIRLLVGRQGKSIFDINLSFDPVLH
jgi:hypothetical protein